MILIPWDWMANHTSSSVVIFYFIFSFDFMEHVHWYKNYMLIIVVVRQAAFAGIPLEQIPRLIHQNLYVRHSGLSVELGNQQPCRWQHTQSEWGMLMGTYLLHRLPMRVAYFEGILPKGPYLPCVSMAGRALLAGYHQIYIFFNIQCYTFSLPTSIPWSQKAGDISPA